MKLWEVARYHMLPPLGITCDAYVFNKAAVEKLPDDLRLILMSLADERFFSRTTEYQLKEAQALTKGRKTMKVEVVQFPKAVEERFAVASKEIMAKEVTKGPLAAKGAAAVASILSDLGYT